MDRSAAQGLGTVLASFSDTLQQGMHRGMTWGDAAFVLVRAISAATNTFAEEEHTAALAWLAQQDEESDAEDISDISDIQ